MTALPAAARSNVRLGAWLAFVLLIAAIAYAGRIAGDPVPQDLFYRWSFFAGALFQFGIVLVITVAIARRGEPRALFALVRPRSWGVAAGMMLAIFVGTLVLAFVVAYALGLRPGEEQGLVPREWDPSRAVPFAANFALAAVFVPIVEELLFRGLGFSLLARFGGAVAIVASGVLFGLAHGLVEALPALVGFGIGLGWLRSRTGSVYPCILLHAIFNAFALLAAVFEDAVQRGA